MSTITIALNKTSKEKKKQLVEKLKKEAAEITEISTDHLVVYVQEHPHDSIRCRRQDTERNFRLTKVFPQSEAGIAEIYF